MYGTGYSIVVRGQEGRSLGSCTDSPCPVNGNGSSWADNPNPQPRTFNDYVTVEVRKFVWNVTGVTASPHGTGYTACGLNTRPNNPPFWVVPLHWSGPKTQKLSNGWGPPVVP